MKTRKAMSLAEVLITLVVIGVLMMVLIPVITKTTANKERFLYKKAVNTLQNAVSAVMNENGVANSTNFWPEMGSLRKEIGSKIITLDGVHSGNDSTATDPDFRSSDGMIWYGIPETWPDGAKYVDVIDNELFKSGSFNKEVKVQNKNKLNSQFFTEGPIYTCPNNQMEDENLVIVDGRKVKNLKTKKVMLFLID